MVFNPTLQGGVRFDQPTQQGPSGVEVLGNVLQGLGAPEFVGNLLNPQAPAAPNNERDRLNASLQTFAQERGISPDPVSWTSRDRAEYRQFDSARYSDMLEIVETTGANTEEMQARQMRDAFNDWTMSDAGVSAEIRARTQFPDDPEQQELFLREQHILFQRDAAQHTELQRNAEASSARGTLSEEAWEIERGNLRDTATSHAILLSQVAPIIAGGGAVPIEELGLNEQLTMLLRRGVGEDSLTSSNIQRAATVYRSSIIRGVEQSLRSTYGRDIRGAEDSYLDEVFSLFDSLVEDIANEVDPREIEARWTSSENMQLMSRLSESGRFAVQFANLSPNQAFQDALSSNPEFIEAIQNPLIETVFGGTGVLSEQDADRLSSDDAEVALEGSVNFLNGFARLSNPSQGQLDSAASQLGSLSALLARTGQAIDSGVYSVLVNPNTTRALDNPEFGEEARMRLSQLIQNDLQQDFDDLAGLVERVDGSLTFENGQFVFTGAEMLSDTGMTMGTRGLNSDGRAILENLNEKLSTMDSSGGEALLGINAQEMFLGGASDVQGSETTGGILEQAGGPSRQEPAVVQTRQGPNVEEVFVRQGPVQSQVYGGLLQRGLPAHIAQGFMMNFEHESGFDPNLEEREPNVHGTRGMGLYQLTGSRREAYEARYGNDYSIDNQLDWLMHELGGSESAAWQRISQTSTAGEAAAAIVNEFLRPAEQHRARREAEYLASNPMQDYQPVQITPPQGATQLYENSFATPGRSPIVSMDGASRMTQPYAADRMQEVLSGPFQQLQQLFGGAVTINDAIARDGTSRESETPGSRHFHGDALDLDISGMSNEERLRLVRSAYAAGFRGFGFGDGILHVDMGAPRSWAYDNDTFGGMPVGEVQQMVATGEFVSDFGMASGVTQSGDPVADMAADRMNATPDYDPGEGAPSNFTVYDQQNQTQQTTEAPEPEEVSVTTPEQGGSRMSGEEIARRSSTPVNREVMDLIREMTESGDEESLRELVNYIRANSPGIMDSSNTQGPR